MEPKTIWDQWKTIPYQKRNEIIAHYGLKRSANVKVVSTHYGDGHVEDDGIREPDLQGIAHLALSDVMDLKPIDFVVPSSKIPVDASLPPKAEGIATSQTEKVAVKAKRGRPRK